MTKSSTSQDAWASRKYVECASTDFLCNIQNDGVIDQPGCMGEQMTESSTSPHWKLKGES